MEDNKNEKSNDKNRDGESQSPESLARLRALLDGVELTPEQTQDDIAPPTNRDRELLEDVPPHHG